MVLTFDDNYIIMAFMNERQSNKQAKNTLKKNQNYSRMPLTNDDDYGIMAIMTNNNNTTVFFERFTMRNFVNRGALVLNVAVGWFCALLCGALMTFPIWGLLLFA